MTESEWLAATDPTPMLECLQGKASDRKLRLVVVASCYRIWHLLPPPSRTFSATLEAFADGRARVAEYRTARDVAFAEAGAANHGAPDTHTYATVSIGISDPPTVASVASCLDTAATAFGCASAEHATEGEEDTARRWARGEQSRLVLDIFGNPFRPVTVDPSWLTTDVVALATSIYEERDFGRMPILADALQDAGCDNDDILTHLRDPNAMHVRGCWVVDAVLGKS